MMRQPHRIARIVSQKSSFVRFKHLFSSDSVLVFPPRPHLCSSALKQASPAQKRTLLEAFTCPNTPGGSSTMLKRYSRHMGIYSYADVDRKSNTRWSSPGTPPIASAPSASSP